MKNKNKMGLFSVILLGFNAIIGSGIFLLPNKVMALVDSAAILVTLFDALLVVCIAMCFAEVGGMFKKTVHHMFMQKKLLVILSDLKLDL